MPRFNKLLSLPLLLAATGLPAFAGEEGVSAKAPVLFHIGPLPVTNSMVTSWIVAVVLIVAIRFVIKKPKLVPSRGQAVVESLVGTMRELFEPIVGKKAMPAAFPILLCFFIFILLHNWSGLLPGVGTIGWGSTDAEGHFHLTTPWIRPANSDFNATIALAIISFGAWLVIIF